MEALHLLVAALKGKIGMKILVEKDSRMVAREVLELLLRVMVPRMAAEAAVPEGISSDLLLMEEVVDLAEKEGWMQTIQDMLEHQGQEMGEPEDPDSEARKSLRLVRLPVDMQAWTAAQAKA